ncbi:TPA: hypothetical protein DCW56_00665 [Candidatus Peregrinibacteria bacterium]|nr:MAG: Aminopeptidase P [Candidatus Peregrinibacteria bacterium GW2011_GWA2_43_8]HAU39430.1 hypothetical protein [Candidatus Peregrinibacteria bacterium]
MNKIMNLLITSEPNIRYLSNFTGSKAIILQTPKHNYFITDARYFDEAKKIIPQDFILEKYKKTDFEDFWAKTLKKHHIKELFFEADHLTYSALKKWKEISRPTKLLPQSGGIEKLRAIKKAEEIALITHSQRINEQIFYSIIKLLKPGIKESEIAWRIHEIGRDLSFEPIIAFGKNSGIPHHQSDNTRLKKGDVVLIDMGVKYKGYCSDMTRTLFTKTPTQFEAKIYETVLETQNKAVSKIKPGITGHKTWSAATQIFKKNGYLENFTHGLGHGVGLQIHESPNLAEKSKDKLKEGMIITLEPGIYIEGKFGVRIEDMGIVTKDGFKNLTKVDKKPIVLP